MNQEIINLVVSWVPSIAAVSTIIVSVIKIIKSLTSQYDTLKKEFASKLGELQKNQAVALEQNITLSMENFELKKIIEKLTKDLDVNKELNESIVDLKKHVEELSGTIEQTVNDKLQQGFDGIKQMEEDMKKIGE